MELRNFQFLCYGLGAAWLIVIVYIFVLAQRSRSIRQELERVKRMVGDEERDR